VEKSMAFAVAQEYVDKDHPLQDNDELAFIPPVSGG
jgi:molybdopterin converting factor small subunit